MKPKVPDNEFCVLIDCQEKNYILHDLPENYRLFEHVKSKALDADGKPQKAIKTHAGGGHDRQDAYLYGHPLGRKKRFRSPADFFPHLLWLVTDEDGDRNNCCCKLCSPEELQPDEKATSAKSVKPESARKEEKSLAMSPTVKKEASTPVAKQVKPLSGLSNVPSSKRTVPVASSASTPISGPSLLTQPRNIEQSVDATYNQFLFRPGEILWFSRGEAWGLGLVTRRYGYYNGISSKREKVYLVQPLSHPYAHPAIVKILREDLLRPWLAWSAPPYTCELLNNINLTYDAADWQGILNKKFGYGDAEVDGSILAAKAADASFTTFDLIKRVTVSATVEELYWNGIFLGCEKIWAGDPARVRGEGNSDVLVVTCILERRTRTLSGGTSEISVQFIGDIYNFSATHSKADEKANENVLPVRMREDLKYRNKITANASRPRGYWKLVQKNVKVDVNNIKGRWYESSLLFPILRGAAFADDVRRGEIHDTGLWMNARGESVVGFRGVGERKPDRLSALGAAVPRGTQIVEGTVDPPPKEDPVEAAEQSKVQQRLGPARQQQQQVRQQVQYPQLPQQNEGTDLSQVAGHEAAPGSLEDFMDLEGVPGFGQEYNSQSQSYL